jgi:hypothetical protein
MATIAMVFTGTMGTHTAIVPMLGTIAGMAVTDRSAL